VNADPQATTARIERAARALTTLTPLLLGGHIRPATQGRIGTVTASTSRPAPGGTNQQSLAREINETLVSWVELLMDERDLRPTVTKHDTRGLAGIIAAHAAWLGQHDSGPDCADELTALVRSCQGLVDPKSARQFYGPCPAVVDGEPCARDLRAREEDGVATCSVGHATEAAPRRSAALAEAAWQMRTLQWVADASIILWGRKVTVKSLEWHVNKGRLTTTKLPGERAHLVRVADVDAVLNPVAEPATA